VTLLQIIGASDPTGYLDLEGLLDHPLGYHNAVAGFLLVCSFPALVVAADKALHWAARGALSGSVTIAIGLSVLTQSRGAVIAMAVGLLVLVLVSRSRLGMLGWVAIAVAPVALALPVLLNVYSAAGDGVEGAAGELNAAGVAIALAGLAAAIVGGLAARSEDRLVLSDPTRRRLGAAVAVLAVAVVAVPLTVVVAKEGGPASFVDQRLDELSAGSPDVRDGGSRLSGSFGSDRGDLWAVALDEGVSHPVAGLGAGGFEYSFLEERESPDELTSEDPHSVPLLMLSELGVVGLILFAAFVVGATLAVWRSRRLGPAAAALSAVALSCFAYWLVHASVDWFWSYPAITAPVMMLLGAAAAPALRVLEPRLPTPRRAVLALGLVLVAVAQAPLFVSERLLRSGIETGDGDLEAAYSDLGLAADLNPWSPAPLIAEAELAEGAGEDQRALALLNEAEERKPIDWTSRYIAARILARTDPDAARRELAAAKELNPQGKRILEAEATLDEPPNTP
jgi:hypothetical protein